MVKKKKAEIGPTVGTSVKSYQQDIDTEKQNMGAYSKKFRTTVRSLQANWKKHAKDLNEAALQMHQEGIKNMTQKVGKFNNEIKEQIRENKEAIARMADNVKFFQSEINKKNKDFQAYARGPFSDYIKAFWG